MVPPPSSPPPSEVSNSMQNFKGESTHKGYSVTKIKTRFDTGLSILQMPMLDKET